MKMTTFFVILYEMDNILSRQLILDSEKKIKIIVKSCWEVFEILLTSAAICF